MNMDLPLCNNVFMGDSLTEVWANALNNVYYLGHETAPRGQKTKETIAAKFVIRHPRRRIPMIPFRRWSLAYACGELAWYLSGSDDLEYIKYYAPSYGRFSDDGAHLYGAYGPRIFGEDFAITPWEQCANKLQEDPDTRQAIIPIYQPRDVGAQTKDYPCTLTLQFLRRGEKLCLIVNMRSNDLWLGTLYDIFCFTALQELMANRLGLDVGPYVHQAGSLHLYERNWEAAVSVLEYFAETVRFTEPDAGPDAQLGGQALSLLPLRAAWSKALEPKVAEERLMSKLASAPPALTLQDYAEFAWLWKRVQMGTEISEASRRTIEELLRQKLGGVFNLCFF